MIKPLFRNILRGPDKFTEDFVIEQALWWKCTLRYFKESESIGITLEREKAAKKVSSAGKPKEEPDTKPIQPPSPKVKNGNGSVLPEYLLSKRTFVRREVKVFYGGKDAVQFEQPLIGTEAAGISLSPEYLLSKRMFYQRKTEVVYEEEEEEDAV